MFVFVCFFFFWCNHTCILTSPVQVQPFQGEFDEYKEEILAEIHANEEQALIEAELRAKARQAKKEALVAARASGKGGVKLLSSADGSGQVATDDDVQVNRGAGAAAGAGEDEAGADGEGAKPELDEGSLSLLFGKKKDKKKKDKKKKDKKKKDKKKDKADK